jgi:hypothetical protein
MEKRPTAIEVRNLLKSYKGAVAVLLHSLKSTPVALPHRICQVFQQLRPDSSMQFNGFLIWQLRLA